MNWLAKINQLVRYHLSSFLNLILGRQEKVRWLTWEITDACNSRCLLCDIWKTKKAFPALTLEEVKRTFSDPLFNDLECVLITGGEPVLRSDLTDIILFIHKKLPRVRFTLSTNAILAEKVLETVKKVLLEGVAIDVGISLDGIGEQHDRIRGVSGNFAKADWLVQQLKQLEPRYPGRLFVVVGLTLHPITVDYVRDVEAYARKNNVHFIVQLYDEAPYYHNVGKSSAVEVMDKDTERMIAEIDHLRPSLHNLMMQQILVDKKIKFSCFAMKSFFILRANGDVMPCLRLSDRKVGNVREMSPSQLWNSRAAREARQMVTACAGCGNTWATDWSLYNNVFPFLPLITKFMARRLSVR